VTGRLELGIAEALVEALRPLVRELIDEQLDLRLAEIEQRRDRVDYLTTGEYADRFRTTPGAVLARINRGTLRAVRPPGSRSWLIPVDDAAVLARAAERGFGN
jgi:hypothetical protein